MTLQTHRNQRASARMPPMLDVSPPSPRRAGEANASDEPRAGDVLLTVIVPVFNEANTVLEVLTRVLAVPQTKQVIIVDDGSTDGTGATLRSWAATRPVELIEHPRNLGKGRAIRTALARARGELTIIQDADLEYDPADYPGLVAPVLGGVGDVVYGSRYLGVGRGSARAPLGACRVAVWALNWCVRCLYGVKLTDEATCYKVFRTTALRAMDLQCERFEFCPEVTAKSCRMGLRILEVPVRYCARTVQQGKKIGWRDGVEAFRTLWRWRHWSLERPRGGAEADDPPGRPAQTVATGGTD